MARILPVYSFCLLATRNVTTCRNVVSSAFLPGCGNGKVREFALSVRDENIRNGPESGLDRMDDTVFVLMILSRIADRRRRRRFAPSLTKSSTRTIQHPCDQGRPPISRTRRSVTCRLSKL